MGVVKRPSRPLAHLLVAASNAPARVKSRADYICDGTADQTDINNAIAALPTAGGVVELTEGTFTISGAITWAKSSVVLCGQGIDATQITAGAATYNAIKVGNRQVDGVMRNFNQLRDFSVTLAGGASNFAVVLLDGAGQGTRIDNVETNEGKYGFELLDLDRCILSNIYANNPRTAAVFLEVGLENTYGTVTFLNPSMVLSDENSVCMLLAANAGQAAPNAIDRVTVIGGLFYSTAGVAGTVGLKATVGATSFNVIGSLFENPIHHVDLYGGNSQIDQMSFRGDTFLQNSGASTNIFRFNTLNHFVTVQDCRLQQATNCFNGVDGYSVVCLLGKNNNQGNITNLWTGQFGAKQGTDTVFAGDDILAMGLDNQRFSYLFTNKVVGTAPLGIRPSANSTTGIQLQQADGTNILNVDTTNSRIGIGKNNPAQALDVNGNIVATNLSGTNTGDQTLPVKASGAEVDTGTDDAKFATAKALADQTVLLKKAGGTMSGALEAADHGDAATDQVINACYGTGDPPAANTTTIGSLYIKYAA